MSNQAPFVNDAPPSGLPGGMKATRLVVGFPRDVPDDIADEIDILTSREALGQQVPTTVFAYDGADGRPVTLVWEPQEQHARTLERLGLGVAK